MLTKMLKSQFAAILFLTFSTLAQGELKEGNYLLLQPDAEEGSPRPTDIVTVQRIEVISEEGKKFLIIRYEGDPNGREPSQIKAELRTVRHAWCFYRIQS